MQLDIVDKQHFKRVATFYTDVVELAVKELLETKHLYQSISISWPDPDAVYLYGSTKFSSNYDVEDWHELANQSKKIGWVIVDKGSQNKYLSASPETMALPTIMPIVHRTVKIYCQICQELNPFNFVDGFDLFNDFGRYGYFTNHDTDEDEQTFVHKYQCQGCKSHPTVFLIQRYGSKISTTGRVPIEKVVVPRFIPKVVGKYYSDAVIAYNSGQVLPAKFMLRVFLEQFVRDINSDSKSEDIEKLFDVYKDSLLEDFKQRFPSLKAIYDALSKDIHSADDTPNIFVKSKSEIDLHFEGKKLYEAALSHSNTPKP